MKTVLNENYDVGFVKGVGDGLIFSFTSPSLALEATRAAKAQVDSFDSALSNDDPWKGRLRFRFVIHWASDGVINGWYDLREMGLRAVVETENSKDALFGSPQSPDHFGHHMNYAARCIDIVSKSEIYLTKHAYDRLVESGDKKIESQVNWPIVIGGAKGLTDSIVMQMIKDDEDNRPREATEEAYETKAIVHIPIAEKDVHRIDALYEALMSKQYKTDLAFHKLVPHLFLILSIDNYLGVLSVPPDGPPDAQHASGEENGARTNMDEEKKNNRKSAPRLILRMECLKSKHLEELLLDEAMQGIMTGNVQSVFTSLPEPPAEVVNTITRFIRTPSSSSQALWKWASRSCTVSPLVYFLEIQPHNVKDIDTYTSRIIDGSSPGGLNVIEVGRLWGEPSIYAVISSPCSLATEKVNAAITQIILRTANAETGTHRCKGAKVDIWDGKRGVSSESSVNWSKS